MCYKSQLLLAQLNSCVKSFGSLKRPKIWNFIMRILPPDGRAILKCQWGQRKRAVVNNNKVVIQKVNNL